MAVKINEFPTKTELERVTTLRRYQKLYENKHYEVLGIHDLVKNQYKKLADLVYLAHAVPARITEFYGDFVQGDVDRLLIQAGTENTSDQDWVESIVYENDLKEKISDIAEEQSEFGFTVLLGWADDEGMFHIDSVGADQYFPQRDGSVVFATYRYDPADPFEKALLLHTQHYILENKKVRIEHQAFRADDKGIAIDPYPLEAMASLVGRPLPPVETIDIDELPIRQVDNGRRTKWGYGKSDYHDIMPQMAEINERATHASTVFLKNISAKLVLPKSAIGEDGKIKEGDTFQVETKEDPLPQYVTNMNPLLADAREHIMSELKFVEWVTGVPMWALTRGAGVERVESLRIQMFSAIRKTAKKRAKIRRALLDMFRIGAKMTSQSEELKTQDVVIDFSDALPVDELVQIQVESEKIRSGLSSRASSIRRVENYNEERTKREIEDIKAEDQIAGIGNPNNAPTL